MARNLQWQLCIDSDAGNQYTAKIYTTATVSSVVTLTAAADPIITADDSGDDLFKAIRHSSGYLRFIGGSSLAAAIMPDGMTDRFVEICEGSTVVWCGYLSPQAFESPWDSVQEYELPMHGALRVLDSIDWPAANTGTYSFAAVILACIEAMAERTDLDYIYLPNHLYSCLGWLALKLQGMNFLSSADNEDGSTDITSAATYADVLTAICNLFGLQVRMAGRSLVFSDYAASQAFNQDGASTFFRFSVTALYNYVNSGTTFTPDSVNITSHAMTSLSVRGADNSFGSLLGRHKITVTSDINEVGDMLEAPIDKVPYICKGATVNNVVQDTTKHFWRSNQLGTSQQPKTLRNGRCEMYVPSDSTSIKALCVQTDKIDSDETLLSYNWTNGICLNTLTAAIAVRITSLFEVNVNTGLFYVAGDFKDSWVRNIQFYFKVGDKYWNSSTSSWSTTAHINTAQIVGSDGYAPAHSDGSVKNTFTAALSQNYPNAEGFPISVNTSLSGKIELLIVDYSASSTRPASHYYDIMTSLRIGYVRYNPTEVLSAKTTNTYTAAVATAFSDDFSLSNKLASDKGNPFGFAMVMNGAGSLLSTWTFQHGQDSVATLHPEQEVANAAAAHYGKRCRTIRATVSGSANTFTCAHRLYYNNVSYAIVSVSQDYIRDEATIYAVEL